MYGPKPPYFGLLASWLSAKCLRGTGHTKSCSRPEGKHKSSAEVARCQRKTKSCRRAGTGELLLDSNVVLRKQSPRIAAQETVTCPKAVSGTGRTSLGPYAEPGEAALERQLCRRSQAAQPALDTDIKRETKRFEFVIACSSSVQSISCFALAQQYPPGSPYKPAGSHASCTAAVPSPHPKHHCRDPGPKSSSPSPHFP